jgi:hypothetical protein
MNIRYHSVFVTAALVLAASSASALSILGRTHLVHPASECAVKPLAGGGSTPGSIVWGSLLINNTGATQEFQCPITTDTAGYELQFAALNVSPGWATTSSCQMCVGSSDGSLWCYAPSYVSHPSSARDSVVWDGPGSVSYLSGYGAEIQCGLPNGQQARDFYVDNNLYVW